MVNYAKGDDLMYYTRRLKEIREDRDLTQEDLAKVLQVKQQQYQRWESGVNKLSAENLIALCKFYNLSADYLLGLTDQEKNYK